MRLILSRKGFDSQAGGCPSPIFPDGSMIALPIPVKGSPIRYGDLTWRGRNLGDLVTRLTKGRHTAEHGAHLDPDVRRDSLPRDPDWRPAFGQVAAAQGHLRKQHVDAGDLFLFWGLFRAVDHDLRWVGPPQHLIWGWLQVDLVASVDEEVRRGGEPWRWARHHPHLSFGPDATNTLYVGARRLKLPGQPPSRVAGAGTFDTVCEVRRLSAPDSLHPSNWLLPAGFLPRGRPPLTYHRSVNRWQQHGDQTLLRVVDRGQEFLLDLHRYPEILPWLAEILRTDNPTRGFE